jgi:(2Fe-2S) ferredoxin
MVDLTVSSPKRRCVLVCQHRSCVRNGATEVLESFQKTVPPGVLASGSDCLGQCASGPTVQIMPDGTWYCRIKPSDVAAIVEQHLQHDRPIAELLHPRFHPRYDAYPPL